MVLLYVSTGAGSWWVLNTDEKGMHECVLGGLALPGVPSLGITVGQYLVDPWILLVFAVFEGLFTDDG